MKHYCIFWGIVIGFVISGATMFADSNESKTITYENDYKVEEEHGIQAEDSHVNQNKKLPIPIDILDGDYWYWHRDEVPYFDDVVIKIKNKTGDSDVYLKGKYEESINIKYDWDVNQDMQKYFLGKDLNGNFRGNIVRYCFCRCQYEGYWGIICVCTNWVESVVEKIYVCTFDNQYPVNDYDLRMYYNINQGGYVLEKYEFVNKTNNQTNWVWNTEVSNKKYIF